MANTLRACMIESDEEDEDGNLTEINSKTSSSISEASLKEVGNFSDDKSSSKMKGRKKPETSLKVVNSSDDKSSPKRKGRKKSEIAIKEVVSLSDDKSTSKKRGRKKSEKPTPVLDLCSDTNDSDIQIVEEGKRKIKRENNSKASLLKPKPEEEEPSITDELTIYDDEDMGLVKDEDEVEESIKEEDDDEVEESLKEEDNDEEEKLNEEDEEEEEEEEELDEEDDGDESYKEDEHNGIDSFSDDGEESDLDPDFEVTKNKSTRKKPQMTRGANSNMFRGSKLYASKTQSTVMASEENSDDSSSSESNCEVESLKHNKKFIRQKTPKCDALMIECMNQYGISAPEKENLTVSNSNNNLVSNKEKSQDDIAISSELNKVDEKSDSFLSVTIDSNLSNIEKSEIEVSASDPLSVKVKEETEIKTEITDEKKEDIKLFCTKDAPEDSMDCDDNQEVLTENQSYNEENHLKQNLMSNKRKRTSRNNEVVEQTISRTTPTQLVNDSPQGTEVVKKRRGRPPKVQLPNAESSNGSNQTPNIKRGKSVNKPSSDLGTTTSVNVSALNDSQPNTVKKRGRPSRAKAGESLLLSQSWEQQSELRNDGSNLSNDRVSFIADFITSYQNVFDDAFFLNILPLLSEIVMLCMDEFTELLDRQKKAASLSSEELSQQEIGLAKKSFWTMVATYSDKFFPSFNSVMYKINQMETKNGLIVALLVFIANTLQNNVPKSKGSFHMMRKVIMCMCRISNQDYKVFQEMLMTSEDIFNKNLWHTVKLLMIFKKSDILSIPDTTLSVVTSSDNLDEICQSIFSSITNTVPEICKLNMSDKLLTPSKKNSSFKLSELALQLVAVLKQKPIKSKKMQENLDLILSILKESNRDSGSVSSEVLKVAKAKVSAHQSNSISLGFEETIDFVDEQPVENEDGGLDRLLESYLKSSDANEDFKPEIFDVDFEIDKNNQSVHNQVHNGIDNLQSLDVEEVDCANFIPFPDNLITSGNSTNVNSLTSEQDPLSF